MNRTILAGRGHVRCEENNFPVNVDGNIVKYWLISSLVRGLRSQEEHVWDLYYWLCLHDLGLVGSVWTGLDWSGTNKQTNS